MPEIKGLPQYKAKPGANPLRVKTIEMLRAMASDPTSLEVMPLGGMTRALKGTPAYHGFRTPPTKPRYTDMARMAEEILEAEHGKDWPSKLPKGTYSDLAEKLMNKAEKAEKKSYMFDKFEPAKAGTGAGGNLYDEGIYLSGHSKVSKGYGNALRKHNIPPQAKLFEMHKPLKTLDDALAVVDEVLENYPVGADRYEINDGIERIKRFYKANRNTVDGYMEGEHILSQLFNANSRNMNRVVTSIGYDGISYDAGRVLGLPRGVPEGTKNFVIYNYDIINNPRKVAIERGFKKAKQP